MSEFVQLGKPYESADYASLKDYWASEKLDGMYAIWDGGVSRGMFLHEVPWYNPLNKTDNRSTAIATGLWSRYGNPIFAPSWFLDQLPKQFVISGELYIAPGKLQETLSIVRQYKPDERWQSINFAVFDHPSIAFFMARDVSVRVNKKSVKWHIPDSTSWVKKYDINCANFLDDFASRYAKLMTRDLEAERVFVLDQVNVNQPEKQIPDLLNRIYDHSGEGLILKTGSWQTKRTSDVLKIKASDNTLVIVTGWHAGEGRNADVAGSLEVIEIKRSGAGIFEPSGSTFKINILGDANRQIGQTATDAVWPIHYPRGSVLSIRYMTRTASGLPREARIIDNA